MIENPQYKAWLKESLLNFTMIKKNIYLDRKKNNRYQDELDPCNCRPLQNEME